LVNKKNTVRITGGLWKRTPVPVFEGGSVRPTPGRVRETIFNWIRQDRKLFNCEVLDLFCGTGILGLEALSRGAKTVSFVDKNSKCLTNIEDLLARLNASERATLINEEVWNWLQHNKVNKYDLIFLDPPFALDNPSIFFHEVKQVMKEKGLVYLENKRSQSISLESGVECWKSANAGIIHYGLYRIL